MLRLKNVQIVGRSDLALVLDVLDDILHQIFEVGVFFHSLGYACYGVNDGRVVSAAEFCTDRSERHLSYLTYNVYCDFTGNGDLGGALV